jgi:hypothetical protein
MFGGLAFLMTAARASRPAVRADFSCASIRRNPCALDDAMSGLETLATRRASFRKSPLIGA